MFDPADDVYNLMCGPPIIMCDKGCKPNLEALGHKKKSMFSFKKTGRHFFNEKFCEKGFSCLLFLRTLNNIAHEMILVSLLFSTFPAQVAPTSVVFWLRLF
jgi:hypothetical protein